MARYTIAILLGISATSIAHDATTSTKRLRRKQIGNNMSRQSIKEKVRRALEESSMSMSNIEQAQFFDFNSWPTYSPTASTDDNMPTYAPTGENTCRAIESTSGQFIANMGLGLLRECQGDCNSDADCGGTLVCQLREGSEVVQGCEGDCDDGVDYCIDSSTPVPTESPLVGETPAPSVVEEPAVEEPAVEEPAVEEPTPSVVEEAMSMSMPLVIDEEVEQLEDATGEADTETESSEGATEGDGEEVTDETAIVGGGEETAAGEEVTEETDIEGGGEEAEFEEIEVDENGEVEGGGFWNDLFLKNSSTKSATIGVSSVLLVAAASYLSL